MEVDANQMAQVQLAPIVEQLVFEPMVATESVADSVEAMDKMVTTV